MRNRIILFKLFVFITFCFINVGLYAQNKTVKHKASNVNLTGNKDSLPKNVRLVYNQSIPANLTVASSAVVYNKNLIQSPAASVLNALTGRLSGLSTSQFSGLPGSDGVSVSLRGVSPLILIDGIPRNLTTIDLQEVESITVLKDALGTAMLGVRGARGALLITTRQGSAAKQQISFTAQTSMQQPLKMPQALSAFNYATLRNEAVQNEININPNYPTNLLYTAADLQAYQTGSDPVGHPDIDWRKQVLRNTSKFDRYSLNVTGGSTTARYYVGLEHFNQDGLLKTDAANKYNTNNGINGSILRSNIDININKKLIGGIHLLGRIINVNEPGAGINSIFNSFLNTPATAYVPINPDGSYGGVQQYQNNIQAQATGSGYLESYNRDILADFYLKRTLDEIIPGLWAKAVGSYSANLTENINRSKPIVVYQRLVNNGVESYNQYGVSGTQLNTNAISSQGRQSYFEASIGYNHVFNGTHGIDMVVLGNIDNSVANSDLPYTITGTSGRLSYNYKQKYIAEVAYGVNGSNRYFPNGTTRYGFFPAFGLGWNITKESFMENSAWLNNLKLSGSYGKVGNDVPGYFSYIQRYNNGAAAYFGSSASGNPTLVEASIANANITWEKGNKLNIGLAGAMFKNRLGFNIEYYNNKYYDLLQQRGQNTSLLGNNYPAENIGQTRFSGWDFDLSWQNEKRSDFNYFVSANASLQKTELLYSNEVNQPYDYMRRTGQPVGQPFGFTADGLFQSQAEIDHGGKNNGPAPTFLGYTPQPGDIKYKDLNGDGVINQLDITSIGSAKPQLVLGLNFGFDYKGFDFSALFQGIRNINNYLSGNSYWEFQNGGFGQAYTQQLDRWTPSNPNASYPRLGIGSNTNNQAFSSYWYRKADYLRLKNAEIGYTVPARFSNIIKLPSVRVFANGLNLFTITSLKDVDPEVYNGAYPIQRVFNIGVNVKL